jgi:hypothetical protein
MDINKIELTQNSQSFFDSFNNFILSDDRKVFNKLVARTLLYNEVKDIPGDIVECGVFKGTGMYTFLKLKNLYNPNSSKKVIGFDFFNTDNLLSSIQNITDKEAMSTLFNGRNFNHGLSFKEQFQNKLLQDGFNTSDFLLVEGDISLTSKKFVSENPGFKISLLYLDLDIAEPTYDALNNMWDNVTKGGIIVFDEYGYHAWSESMGVDKFCKEKNIEIKSLNYMCPTAYIKKQ